MPSTTRAPSSCGGCTCGTHPPGAFRATWSWDSTGPTMAPSAGRGHRAWTSARGLGSTAACSRPASARERTLATRPPPSRWTPPRPLRTGVPSEGPPTADRRRPASRQMPRATAAGARAGSDWGAAAWAAVSRSPCSKRPRLRPWRCPDSRRPRRGARTRGARAPRSDPAPAPGRALPARRARPLREQPGRLRRAAPARGPNVCVVGWLAASRRVRTSDGQWMRFLTFEDTSGLAEIVLFSAAYQRSGHRLVQRGPFLAHGASNRATGPARSTRIGSGDPDRYRPRARGGHPAGRGCSPPQGS